MCQQNWMILVVVVCAAYIQGCQGSDTTVLTPLSVETAENTNVTLTCSYNGQFSGAFVWFLNESHSTPQKMVVVNCTVPEGWLRNSIHSYTCTNSTTNSVTIKSITQQRHGETWGCAFSPGASTFYSNIVRILVTVPVKEATITSTPHTTDSILTIAEGSVVDWKCTSSPCQPKPKFRWYIKQDQNSIATILPETTSTESITDVIQTYTSTLATSFNRTFNGWLIFCGSQNNDEVLSERILINITYPPDGPPSIEGFGNGSEIKVIRYGFVHLTCSVTGGNPLPRLEWSHNNDMQQIVSVTTVTKRIAWQANDINRVEMRCQSTYFDLIYSTSVSVNVLYPPDKPVIKVNHSSRGFIPVNNTLTVIEGQPFILNCSAESNPPPTFEWNNVSYTPGFILNITNATGRYSQTITCKASNEMQTSYPEPSMTKGSNTTYFDLNVLYPPTMKTMKNITLKEGQNLNYACNYENGNPDVINITWSWMNKTWTGRQLEINNVSRNQAGLYRCSVQNFMISWDGTQDFGHASGQFHLLVQNYTNNGTSAPLSNASLVITGAAAGATGGVIVILVLIIVFILYKRRKRLSYQRKDDLIQYYNFNQSEVNECISTTADNANAYEAIQHTGSDRQYDSLSAVDCKTEKGFDQQCETISPSASNVKIEQPKVYENLQ